jgi:microcompartment protein CcmK/EutM
VILGRVAGAVWGARRSAGLAGRKLLQIRPLGIPPGVTGDLGGSALLGEGLIVAVDGLAAGPGDLVLVAHGSRVRDLTVGERTAVKDVVVAIVDRAEIAGGAP